MPLSWGHLCHELWQSLPYDAACAMSPQGWTPLPFFSVMNSEGYPIIIMPSVPWTLMVTPLSWCHLCYDHQGYSVITKVICATWPLKVLLLLFISSVLWALKVAPFVWPPRVHSLSCCPVHHMTSQGCPIILCTIWPPRVHLLSCCPVHHMTSQGCPIILCTIWPPRVHSLSCTSHDFSRLPHYPVYHLTSQGSLIVLYITWLLRAAPLSCVPSDLPGFTNCPVVTYITWVLKAAPLSCVPYDLSWFTHCPVVMYTTWAPWFIQPSIMLLSYLL